ncbi:MAG: hypothetical protein QGM50_02610 [Anaerolineae bacterium]|nr:hypothetical protein [Anaerolineae bacterium]MDK1117663.1 hypothetical protein [Anaerolineae bacterium]
MDWQTNFNLEIDNAQTARSSGNEGRARVCARRAAGIAIREYFTRRGETIRKPSSYDLLEMISGEKHLSTEIRRAAKNLTLRITEDSKLPIDVNLIQEARLLCEGLLSE